MFCDNCPCTDFCKKEKLLMDVIPEKRYCDVQFEKLTVDEDYITSDDFWFYKIHTEGNDLVKSMEREWIDNVLCKTTR